MRLQPLCIIIICAWTALSAAGCTGLIVTHHKGTTAGPGNVVSLFSVARRDGKPLGQLTASNFEIYERNKLVPASVTRQKLVSANRVVDHYTLLLLDLGLCDLKEASLQAVIDATSAFVDKRSKRSKIGIFGFDGGESINQLSDFTNDAQSLKRALAALKQTKERDPSTDINGSMIKALEAMRAAWKRSALPVRWGTVVLITNSTDHARRVSQEAMLKALDQAKVQRYALGVGDAVDLKLLHAVGTGGAVHVNLGTEAKPVVTEEDRKKGVTSQELPARPLLSKTLDQLAVTLEEGADKLHVLSYCSPLRAGEHYVRVKVSQGQMDADFQFKIDAAGFGKGCDPHKIPTF
jgi:hypothetical protein